MSPISSSSSTLPTFDVLGIRPPEPIDADTVARDWIDLFAARVASQDVSGLVAEALSADPWWRDLFALTWDIRTFHGRTAISTVLLSRLASTSLGYIRLLSAKYQTPYPDLAWVVLSFAFTTDVGLGRGEARLVYERDSCWRAAAVYTNLEGLRDFPERLGPHRDFAPDHGAWAPPPPPAQPDVLIIGGGQSGLAVAARLDALGVSNLVVEADERVGDSWRERHEMLSLHGPIWQNHMPYLPFPSTWPVFIPAKKFASWLELYASALELNVQTSTRVTSLRLNPQTQKWTVTLRTSSDGADEEEERTIEVKHVVVAAGWPFKQTRFAGEDEFAGTIVHSKDFRSAAPYVGKRVLVVGAASSAHDAASSCAALGIAVTLHQRSPTFVMSIASGMLRVSAAADWEAPGTATEDVDRGRFALPVGLAKGLAARGAGAVREADRAMLEGLERAGYRTSRGEGDAGAFFHLLRGSGYYLDRGSAQQIIDGKIRVKSGVDVERLTPRGVRFSDGSGLETDVVVVATGFDDVRLTIQQLLSAPDSSPKLSVDDIPPIWQLNDEGELSGVYRDLAPALPNVWPILGNLAWVRWFSRHVALQIKAKVEGVYSGRYEG